MNVGRLHNDTLKSSTCILFCTVICRVTLTSVFTVLPIVIFVSGGVF